MDQWLNKSKENNDSIAALEWKTRFNSYERERERKREEDE